MLYLQPKAGSTGTKMIFTEVKKIRFYLVGRERNKLRKKIG